MTGVPYQTAGNKFTAQATLDRMVREQGRPEGRGRTCSRSRPT